MDYPFEHPDFQGRSLAIRIPGLFSAARLVVDGAEVAATKRKFSAYDNQGRPREVKLRASFLDPVPKVVVDGTAIALVQPLRWYEYAWMSLPVLLVFAGGALGALFGMLAAYSSTRIFRSDREVGAKYLLSGALSLGAVAAFFASVVGLQLLIASVVDPASEWALKQVARASNEGLPMTVDDHTELVRVEGLEGVLVYHYRLTKALPEPIPGEVLVQRIRPVVTRSVCAVEGTRERFLDNGVALRYVYSDTKGEAFAQFEVSAEDCP